MGSGGPCPRGPPPQPCPRVGSPCFFREDGTPAARPVGLMAQEQPPAACGMAEGAGRGVALGCRVPRLKAICYGRTSIFPACWRAHEGGHCGRGRHSLPGGHGSQAGGPTLSPVPRVLTGTQRRAPGRRGTSVVVPRPLARGRLCGPEFLQQWVRDPRENPCPPSRRNKVLGWV